MLIIFSNSGISSPHDGLHLHVDTQQECEGKVNRVFCFVKSVIDVCDYGRAHWGQCQLLPELIEGSIPPSVTSGNLILCGGTWDGMVDDGF